MTYTKTNWANGVPPPISAANLQNIEDAIETIDNIFDISTDTAITAAGGITVTKGVMRVLGNGGAVDITANPQIVAGTDGQRVIIQGTNDTNTVKIDDGTGVVLTSGVSFVVGKNDIIEFMYDSGESAWIELRRADN